MKSDTDLELVFKNAAGKKVVLNVEEPKSTVTKAEIDAAMNVVVENNIFATTGGDIVRRRHRGSCGRPHAYNHHQHH